MNVKALIRQAKRPEPGAHGLQAAPCPEGAEVAQLAALPEVLPPVGVDCLVRSGPPSVWLVEEWLPADAEAQLLGNLRVRAGDFVQLRGKRTARFGGDVGPPFSPEALPSWLEQVCEAVRASLAAGGVLAQYSPVPNHVLVNHYRPGEGIMPHTDGPAYEPAAAILSLGSATVFEFWRDHAHVVGGEPPALALLVPPRSLLVFTEEAYSAHLHGIADRRYDEITAVANWSPSSWARWAPSPWAARQLEPAAAEADGDCAGGALPVACGLRREERWSLTIRRVEPAPHELPSEDPRPLA